MSLAASTFQSDLDKLVEEGQVYIGDLNKNEKKRELISKFIDEVLSTASAEAIETRVSNFRITNQNQFAEVEAMLSWKKEFQSYWTQVDTFVKAHLNETITPIIAENIQKLKSAMTAPFPHRFVGSSEGEQQVLTGIPVTPKLDVVKAATPEAPASTDATPGTGEGHRSRTTSFAGVALEEVKQGIVGVAGSVNASP